MTNKKPERRKILYIPPTNDACAWYRCIVPGLELRKRGWHVDFTQAGNASLLKEYDVVVFQRASSEGTLKCIEYCNSVGILTVGEIDDNLWCVHKTNPAYDVWTRERQEGLEKSLRAVQLITTTTPALADYLKRFNSNVTVLPNMLPGEYWNVMHSENPAGKIVIGWAGSSSHWADLELLTGVIPQILDEFPKSEFHIAGLQKTPFAEHPRIKIVDCVQGEDLALLLATFNIGLAPLLTGKFNDCKSDLKYIEYAMVGLPVVASGVDTYRRTISNGENGFIAKNSKDWFKYLRRLLGDPDLRREMGKNAHAYAQTRTIEKNVSMWEEAYGLKNPMTSDEG